ncbi:MAG: phosphate ABC transporter substrate-binding protein PstS [Thaumarchaeota archaeon]|nr:phosphate ABC transporter substrate-binding protein PstS [Nitrososphaerota archaeon]
MNLYKTGASTTTIGLVVVLIVVVVGAGAYVALNPGGGNSSTTSSSTSNTTTTSLGAPVTIQGAGSTLVYPLMSAWTFAYNQLTNVQVNYASVGSGQGIASITAGTVNFGASDAPLTTSQYAALPSGTTLLTVPESDSGVVPAYNIPASAGLKAPLRFTGDVLAKIFLGNITMWNDPAIAALNPGVTLPVQAVKVVHRSDGSGTMFAFTNYLSDSNAYWKQHVGTGTLPNWPTGLGCRGNEGVAGCIQNTPYSIGPLEIAYEIVNKGSISYGSVQNAAGTFVLANLTNIAAGVTAGATGLPAGNAVWTKVSIINNIFNDTKDANIYPITTFTYFMVYQQQTGDQSKATATVNFIWWVVNSAQSAGSNLGYPALPANVVTLDDATINSITYNGTPIHTGS